MARPNKNQYMKGTNGTVWVNGKELGNIAEIEIKVTGAYTDIRTVGYYGTQHVYTGYDGEGTLKLHKIDSTILSLIGDAYKTDSEPEITIITKLVNMTTKKAERIAISEVVFTEYTLAKFDSSDTIEEELPFKFSEWEVLEEIS